MKSSMEERYGEIFLSESAAMLNLFCVSLISAEREWSVNSCIEANERLMEFKNFLQKQEISEKQRYYLEFCEKASRIINKEYMMVLAYGKE